MEKLFTLEYGVGGVCVILTLLVLVRVGEFLWKLREKKDSASDIALRSIAERLEEIEDHIEDMRHTVADIPKLRLDLRRFYSALKTLSGEKWSAIRDEIMKDDFSV